MKICPAHLTRMWRKLSVLPEERVRRHIPVLHVSREELRRYTKSQGWRDDMTSLTTSGCHEVQTGYRPERRHPLLLETQCQRGFMQVICP